ncbi:MAG: porin family protein [Bacteroidales bacterium]
MRYKVLTFCLVLFVTIKISGQTNHFNWGIKIGGNIGAPMPFGHIPEGAKGAPVVGLNLGSWVAWYFNPKLSMNLEFNYSVKGASFTTPLVNQYYEDPQYGPTYFNGTAEGKFDNQYLEWPVVLAYKVSKKVWIIGGVYFAYMFSTSTYATGEGTVGVSPTIITRSLPFDDELNKFDCGPELGARYENGGRFMFDARLAYGLTSVFKKSYKTIDYSINNFYFQFAAHYRFGKDIVF